MTVDDDRIKGDGDAEGRGSKGKEGWGEEGVEGDAETMELITIK